jgi:hypothetical protein
MSFNVVTRYFRLPFRVKMENEKLFVFARNKVVKTPKNNLSSKDGVPAAEAKRERQ